MFRFSRWKLQDYNARLAETLQELERLLILLSDACVDMFHASTRRFWIPEFDGSILNLTGWAKHITGKPSITVGSVGLEKDMSQTISTKDVAAAVGIERLLERFKEDEFDLVAVGRALLADSNWTNKIKRGAISEINSYSNGVLKELI